MDLKEEQINELFTSLGCYPTFSEEQFIKILSERKIELGPMNNLGDDTYKKNAQMILDLICNDSLPVTSEVQPNSDSEEEAKQPTSSPFQLAEDANPKVDKPIDFSVSNIVYNEDYRKAV